MMKTVATAAAAARAITELTTELLNPLFFFIAASV
jgi:hypothetical protein